MKRKSFFILAGITAVAAALAVTSSLTWNQGSAVAERGRIFLPSLAGNGGKIETIIVETGDETMSLSRDGSRFVDASGYPVKRKVARDLLASISVLKIEEKKTSDTTRHADLDLAAPEAERGAGRKITFLDGNGKQLAGLIAGKTDSTVGGVSGGQYVRTLNDNQTYLARGSVKLPYSRAGWFDNKLVEIDPASIVHAAIGTEPGATVRLTRVGDRFRLADLPEGRVEDEDKINRLTRIFSSLSFSDVRKGEGDVSSPTLTVATMDGITFRFTSAGKDEDGAHWVRLGAVSTDDSAAQKVRQLAERYDGFEFKISSNDGNTLSWKIDDLTKAAES